MGRRNGWFTYVKNLFIPHSKPKPQETDQKPKKWRRLVESFKIGQQSLLEQPRRTADEAAEKQRKHALAVAVATAAAADAAVAAADAAAEVVRLSHMPRRVEWKAMHSAAIRIQTAYRAHLARKALSALKGIVKLQAVIRSEITRRNVVRQLASMQANYLDHYEKRHGLNQKEGINVIPNEPELHRDWDFSFGSKEDLYRKKQEALAKRERMRQFSSSSQESRNFDRIPHRPISPKKNRQYDRHTELEVNQLQQDDTPLKLMQLKLRTMRNQDRSDELSSPFLIPRRSFCHARKKSITEEGSLPNSPTFPAYMAATESARAKSRSVIYSKQRLRMPDIDQHSPYKLSLSPRSPANSEMNNTYKRNSTSSLSDRMINQSNFFMEAWDLQNAHTYVTKQMFKKDM